MSFELNFDWQCSRITFNFETVPNVTATNHMFQNAESFNRPLNDWDVSNVKDMA